jgi:BlaI family transcriptional regulator, penicillinase repressor
MEILQVLWEKGPSYTRDIVAALNKGRRKKIAYNSVLTILTIMHTKGLVSREEAERTHIYSPAFTKNNIETRLIQRLTQQVFGGSAMQLVVRALSTQTTSEEDVQKIRQLLETLEAEHEGD